MANKSGGFYFSEEAGFQPNTKKSPKKGDKKDGKKEDTTKQKQKK